MYDDHHHVSCEPVLRNVSEGEENLLSSHDFVYLNIYINVTHNRRSIG